MKRKILSFTLAIAILMSILSVGVISVSAADDGKIKKNSVTFNNTGSETEGLPAGEELSSYIAQKKAQFEEQARSIAGDNGDLADYSSFFTSNTYAKIEKINFKSVTYEESDDAIYIGDIDNWDNIYVVRGWIARVVNYVLDYKLITVDGSAPRGVIDRVEVTVNIPEPGTNSKTVSAESILELDAEHCSIYSAVWLESLNAYSATEPYFEFEGNKGYNMLVTIKADDGYTFEKTGKLYTGIDEGFDRFDGCVTNYAGAPFSGSKTFDDGDYLRLKINFLIPGDPVIMSYIHVLTTEGGSFTVYYEGYDGHDQPYAVPEGTQVTLTAVADEGYKFKGWYEGDVDGASYDEMFTDVLITTDNPYTFAIYGYPYICAKFEKIMIGDANGDTTIDVLDSTVIQKAIVGKLDLTADDEKYLDVNDDGAVDVLDAIDIQKYSIGKITEFKKKL